MTAISAEELLHAGRVDESLSRVQEDVRRNAADPRTRVFLFQILCVLGQWKRALTQLDVLAAMGADHLLLARIFEPVVRAELVREQVFEGRQTPSVFGEPQPWMGLLLRANELAAQGTFAAAQRLRDQAFEEAPPTAGKINDGAFEWIADADPRFGPMLEAIVNGRYLWVPFCRIRKIHLERPTDLRDLVWAPAQFVWVNGGEASGHIPARYPGTEGSSDGTLRLARKTEWSEQPGGYSLGFGQRILTTDVAEYPLLECRTIELGQ